MGRRETKKKNYATVNREVDQKVSLWTQMSPCLHSLFKIIQSYTLNERISAGWQLEMDSFQIASLSLCGFFLLVCHIHIMNDCVTEAGNIRKEWGHRGPLSMSFTSVSLFQRSHQLEWRLWKYSYGRIQSCNKCRSITSEKGTSCFRHTSGINSIFSHRRLKSRCLWVIVRPIVLLSHFFLVAAF